LIYYSLEVTPFITLSAGPSVSGRIRGTRRNVTCNRQGCPARLRVSTVSIGVLTSQEGKFQRRGNSLTTVDNSLKKGGGGLGAIPTNK